MERWQDFAALMTVSEWLAVGSVTMAFLAAWIATYAARIEVSDNIDAFIADLTRQSLWNGRAAAANIIAGALIFASTALNVLERMLG